MVRLYVHQVEWYVRPPRIAPDSVLASGCEQASVTHRVHYEHSARVVEGLEARPSLAGRITVMTLTDLSRERHTVFVKAFTDTFPAISKMLNSAGGLLFVFGQCEPDVSTKDFNDWYDGEHAPARLTVPGINSAIRYKAIDAETPEWLAIYDLASPETTKSPTYLRLRDTASDNEKALIPRLPTLQRRTYSLINETAKPDLPSGSLPGKYILVVLWSIPKELDAELHKWYDKEHNAEIAKVPGWLSKAV